MELSSIATNVALEVDGVWHDLDPTARIKIARVGNPKYSAAIQALSLPSKEETFKSNDTTITDEQLADILANTVVVNWEGLEENGKEIPYSPEKAKEILLNPKYKDLRRWVVKVATDAMFYREESIKEVEEK